MSKKPTPPPIECPPGLGEVGRAEFYRLAIPLEASGALHTDLDGGLLAAYCAAFEVWQAATTAITRDGIVIETPNKFLQPSPYLGIANKAAMAMARLGDALGLSASSRNRLWKHAWATEPADPLNLERLKP